MLYNTNFCGRKLLQLSVKLLFLHKTFVVTCDEPKNYEIIKHEIFAGV